MTDVTEAQLLQQPVHKSRSTKKKEYMVEVFLKPIQIFILPKLRNHPSLKKPVHVFISRTARVIDLKTKMATILHHSRSNKDFTPEVMNKMTRLWKLENGETALSVERDYDNET